MARSRIAVCSVLLGGALLLSLGATAYASPSLPRVMAAAGDSITRGFNATGSCYFKDCPQYSWSTGNAGTSYVNSQYQRLLAAGDAGLVADNDAVTGAKMSALGSQLSNAAAQGADYVTILMGANDVCASDITAATPTATFKQEFSSALKSFFSQRTSALVYVSSLPNVVQLWSVLHNNFSAEFYWHLLNTCPDTLIKTYEQPQVTQLELADDSALAGVCQAYANCLYDGGAAYNTAFPASDISTNDYFHPNLGGQNLIASVTWSHGFWAALP